MKNLCISLARPLVLTPTTNTSVTLGFRLDEACKKGVRFWDDPAIPQLEINETCERCWLSDAMCHDRAVPATIYTQEETHATRNRVLKELVHSFQGE